MVKHTQTIPRQFADELFEELKELTPGVHKKVIYTYINLQLKLQVCLSIYELLVNTKR